jgi:hypothetical protein
MAQVRRDVFWPIAIPNAEKGISTYSAGECRRGLKVSILVRKQDLDDRLQLFVATLLSYGIHEGIVAWEMV